MIKYLLLLLLTPVVAAGQKLLLMDRGFQNPILTCDSFHIELASQGYMPLYIEDINAVLSAIEQLKKQLTISVKEERENFTLEAGHSKFVVARHTNNYHITLSTDTDGMHSSILVSTKSGSKRSMQRLSILSDYIRNNKAVLATRR
ncbi:MAG TPA: hypothetical protein VEZ55_10755 [Chitinophagaceae bacterium]|nr:hypothetical protein [Chitinophagaceae bacterium]